MGIFFRRMNKEGAISGMISGILFTGGYIVYFKFINPSSNNWLFGISPEGIGALGMLINFVVASFVMTLTKSPPKEIEELVENIRLPEEVTCDSSLVR